MVFDINPHANLSSSNRCKSKVRLQLARNMTRAPAVIVVLWTFLFGDVIRDSRPRVWGCSSAAKRHWTIRPDPVAIGKVHTGNMPAIEKS